MLDTEPTVPEPVWSRSICWRLPLTAPAVSRVGVGGGWLATRHPSVRISPASSKTYWPGAAGPVTGCAPAGTGAAGAGGAGRGAAGRPGDADRAAAGAGALGLGDSTEGEAEAEAEAVGVARRAGSSSPPHAASNTRTRRAARRLLIADGLDHTYRPGSSRRLQAAD